MPTQGFVVCAIPRRLSEPAGLKNGWRIQEAMRCHNVRYPIYGDRFLSLFTLDAMASAGSPPCS